METSLIALLVPPLLLIPAMGFLSRIHCKREITGELRRKALHVGTGLIALSFPIYLTTPWMVLTALSIVIAWMIAVRRIEVLKVRFGSCLHGTKRASFGEIYFALSIASLMLLTADRPLFFVIPLLILTLADSAAAMRWSHRKRRRLSAELMGAIDPGLVQRCVETILARGSEPVDASAFPGLE